MRYIRACSNLFKESRIVVYNLKTVPPESEGVFSEDVLGFIEKINAYKMNIHSFIVARRGNIVAEAYAKPFFNADFMHRLYSTSKSIVSLAVGKLYKEGKIGLNDKICDYFPEFIADGVDPLVGETTIEDMLKMAVPHLTDSYSEVKNAGWAESFFKAKGVKPSGTIFDYNSSASFLLGVLVEKLTGKTFTDYLRPEFDEIGVGPVKCVKSPDGYAWGASGVIMTARDLLRTGLLLLDKGCHNGKTLLPRDYIEKATGIRIANYVNNDYTPRRAAGYGYQFWITDEGFSTYGMGSQYVFCFPKKDMIVVVLGDTQVKTEDFCGEFLYEWASVIYKNAGKPTAAGNSYKKLKAALDDFSLPMIKPDVKTDYYKIVDGEKYILKDNPMRIEWIKIEFYNGYGTLYYKNARGEKSVSFGLNSYKKGLFPEEEYYDMQVSAPSLRKFDYYACGEWIEEKKLLIRLYIADTNLGNLFITLSYKNDEVGILMNKRAEFFLDDYEGVAMGKKL